MQSSWVAEYDHVDKACWLNGYVPRLLSKVEMTRIYDCVFYGSGVYGNDVRVGHNTTTTTATAVMAARMWMVWAVWATAVVAVTWVPTVGATALRGPNVCNKQET
ncbi:hypothetical protein E2C01_003312 [Portunus trituberculatus]|uniref:Uncharacterized protein n=1 Tax=Portunus trituberculatus TaxID=210409 RepID=A0A5B7CLV9_PORTR|nr:hypothetical protein [Portunus trituberculatus]